LLVQYADGGYGLSNCPEDQGIYPSLASLFSQSPLLSTLHAVPVNPSKKKKKINLENNLKQTQNNKFLHITIAPVATGTYGAIQNVMRNSTDMMQPPQQSSFNSQPMQQQSMMQQQPMMMGSPMMGGGNRASVNFQPVKFRFCFRFCFCFFFFF